MAGTGLMAGDADSLVALSPPSPLVKIAGTAFWGLAGGDCRWLMAALARACGGHRGVANRRAACRHFLQPLSKQQMLMVGHDVP